MICLPTLTAWCQNFGHSATDKPDIEAISKSTLSALVTGCASAVREIEAGRAYIKSLEAENAQQKLAIAAQGEKINLLQQALSARQEEVASLRNGFDEIKKALAEMKAANDLASERITKLENSRKRRGRIGVALGVAGLVGGLLLK